MNVLFLYRINNPKEKEKKKIKLLKLKFCLKFSLNKRGEKIKEVFKKKKKEDKYEPYISSHAHAIYFYKNNAYGDFLANPQMNAV